MKQIVLTPEILAELQGKNYPSSGGFQGFIRKLLSQTNVESRMLEIDVSDEENIRTKAERGEGGWQQFFGRLRDLIDQQA